MLINFFIRLRRAEAITWDDFVLAKRNAGMPGWRFLHVIARYNLGMIHIWRPWKLFNFQDPLPALFIYVQNSSTPLTLDVKFQTTQPPLPFLLQMITNQLKKTIEGWLFYVIKSFLQVGFPFQYQFISLACISLDFFSFNWSLTICFFVSIYSMHCPKTSGYVLHF